MMKKMPKKGEREPWNNPQRYSIEKKTLRKAPLEDGAMIFSNPTVLSDKVPAAV